MGRLKPIVAMLMLALFAFASSHPLLDGLGLIHHEAEHHSDDHSESERNHDAADGLVRLDSHRDEVPKFAEGAFQLSDCLILTLALLHEGAFERPIFQSSNSPPPELVKTWQFSLRTALPVRAPSFAS